MKTCDTCAINGKENSTIHCYKCLSNNKALYVPAGGVKPAEAPRAVKTERMIGYIRDKLSRGDLLCQLAEEAAELAKAALKLHRAEDGTNPTPVTVEDAAANIKEEIADILLVLDVLGIDPFAVGIYNTKAEKLPRWVRRIEENQAV